MSEKQKLEIMLLRTAILAQAPVGGLNDAIRLIETISREVEPRPLTKVTPEEWERLTPAERERAYTA